MYLLYYDEYKVTTTISDSQFQVAFLAEGFDGGKGKKYP